MLPVTRVFSKAVKITTQDFSPPAPGFNVDLMLYPIAIDDFRSQNLRPVNHLPHGVCIPPQSDAIFLRLQQSLVLIDVGRDPQAPET